MKVKMMMQMTMQMTKLMMTFQDCELEGIANAIQNTMGKTLTMIE